MIEIYTNLSQDGTFPELDFSFHVFSFILPLFCLCAEDFSLYIDLHLCTSHYYIEVLDVSYKYRLRKSTVGMCVAWNDILLSTRLYIINFFVFLLLMTWQRVV